MDHYEAINDILVNLFNEILDIEEKALISGEYKDISVNDMHVIEAIGIRDPRNMSAVSRDLSVTVGTLTIAVNSLVKKGYVKRVRSEEDRRVVLISLTDKGERAYYHHRNFHDKMVLAVLKDLNERETEALTRALVKLQSFFRTYEKENQE
ncbi:MAG: MarR family transcriptional regulator [Eubacteriales bacterium]|nr:MarR family transcriptional regulator [Eubacteriales bacterium]